jgi:hypothetical protein
MSRQRFEYTFVRFGEEWTGGNNNAEAIRDYQRVVHDHAREGWRLVQVFGPNLNNKHEHKDEEQYFELIFERPLEED